MDFPPGNQTVEGFLEGSRCPLRRLPRTVTETSKTGPRCRIPVGRELVESDFLDLVGMSGLDPEWSFGPADFKSAASTNSATSPLRGLLTEGDFGMRRMLAQASAKLKLWKL